MIPGSVVIDLAVEAGGNCPLSKMNEIVEHNGVKIIGYANVPGRVAKDASALYAKNIFNFLSLLIDKENKKINFDFEDEIINSVLLTHDGDVRLEQFK
jgi:NAD(P) transhydrogenase subunit alpha